MAHFAELDNDNKIVRVIVVDNKDILNSEGQEDEVIGQVFCNKLLGGSWIQTSYNGKTRKQFAGIGYQYDKEKDVFIIPQPYKSWSLDKNSDWQAPVERPKDDKIYSWNESELKWEEM